MAWYRKAAEMGDVMAETELARMYDEGEGVAKDPVQALYWYRKLAEQGDDGAEARLGATYARGDGVPREDLETFAWMDLAVTESRAGRSGGLDDRVLVRDSLAARLSPSQLTQARSRSAELRAKIDAQKNHQGSAIFGDPFGADP
jgi:hypothetical protein